MSYYEPDENRAWDAYADECVDNDIEPTGDGFEAWMEEQEDRALDAAESRWEADREDAMMDW